MKRSALGCAVLILTGSCATIPPAKPPAPQVAQPPAPRAIPPRTDFTFDGRFAQGGLVRGRAPAGAVSLRLDGQPLEMAPDGSFLIGFGRDHSPRARIEALFPEGDSIAADLSIAKTEWRIESLARLARGTTPTPEFLRIRGEELAQINAARRIRSDSQGWRQPMLWPATGRISGVFGSQRIYAGEAGAPHSGVDVARPPGTPVVAPADGVVILAAARPFTLEGNLLMIDHGMGLNSAFLHLSRIDVKLGDRVTRGQLVGAIGATGRATGPHLHWGMKWNDERIDPQPLAGPMPGSGQ